MKAGEEYKKDVMDVGAKKEKVGDLTPSQALVEAMKGKDKWDKFAPELNVTEDHYALAARQIKDTAEGSALTKWHVLVISLGKDGRPVEKTFESKLGKIHEIAYIFAEIKQFILTTTGRPVTKEWNFPK